MNTETEFINAVDRQMTLLQQVCGSTGSRVTAETIVESMNDWSEFDNIDDLRHWFIKLQNTSLLETNPIPLFDCRGWDYDKTLGIFKHESDQFFYVQGVRVSNSNNRENAIGWDQPMLTQVGYNGGILGLARLKRNNIPYYLIEAKAEPGNPDKIQISPTLQATYSNLKKVHGGRRPHYASIFETPKKAGGVILFDQMMSEDGGRLYNKRNRGLVVEFTDERLFQSLPINMRWVTLFQLKQLIRENSWVSPHVRSLISGTWK